MSKRSAWAVRISDDMIYLFSEVHKVHHAAEVGDSVSSGVTTEPRYMAVCTIDRTFSGGTHRYSHTAGHRARWWDLASLQNTQTLNIY
jgi:hypothetical protein